MLIIPGGSGLIELLTENSDWYSKFTTRGIGSHFLEHEDVVGDNRLLKETFKSLV